MTSFGIQPKINSVKTLFEIFTNKTGFSTENKDPIKKGYCKQNKLSRFYYEKHISLTHFCDLDVRPIAALYSVAISNVIFFNAYKTQTT